MKSDLIHKADLLVFFGHPLVPAVEHLQPFCLPLPQHLDGDFFSTVEIGEKCHWQRGHIIFMQTDNGCTVLPHFPVLMTEESCHQRGRDSGPSLPCPHRKSNLRQNSETLANGSRVQGKQEAVGELSPCSVPHDRLHKTYCYLNSLQSDWRSELSCCSIHTFLSWCAKQMPSSWQTNLMSWLGIAFTYSILTTQPLNIYWQMMGPRCPISSFFLV